MSNISDDPFEGKSSRNLLEGTLYRYFLGYALSYATPAGTNLTIDRLIMDIPFIIDSEPAVEKAEVFLAQELQNRSPLAVGHFARVRLVSFQRIAN